MNVAELKRRLSIPVVAAPMFLVSGPDRLIACCKAGVAGTLAALPENLKAWRDIWSAGHGVGLIEDVPAVADLVARLRMEYDEARA